MHDRDRLFEQRARHIAEMFGERTASEPEPLSRERIREVIQGILADLEEERRREGNA